MILLVLREGEASRTRTIHPCGSHSREKQWHSGGVRLKGSAMLNEQLVFLAPHHHRIHQSKVDDQNCCRDPRPRGDPRSQGQNGAPKIKRVASVRVRPGHREHGLLVEGGGGGGANRKTDDSHERAESYAARRRLCKPQNKNCQHIAQSNSPSGESRRSLTHAVSRSPRSALITSSTLTCNSDSSGSVPRLYVVSAPSQRSTTP